MILINTFSNLKRIKKLPEVDILVGITSLIYYKSFNYTLKLYCTKNDIKFLKQGHLYELYDIIDTDLFEQNEMLKKIDNTNFWSSRKIEALYNELFILNEECVYSDIDILMRTPLDTSKDVLVWSPEEVKDETIYINWKYLSTPKNYRMPKYILKTKDAFNCGILYFKNKDIFLKYREEYYKFCLNNPCIIYNKDENLYTNNAIGACNAEQRILKAVLTEYKQDINFVMKEQLRGWSSHGVHLYGYRVSWRLLNNKDYIPSPECVRMLNLICFECIKVLKAYNKELYNFYSNRYGLKDVEKKLDEDFNSIPIKEYY